jgi:RimJ/RimL family protein N-acetyltransferase
MFLMMLQAFEELKYRRYECKCAALNEKSRKAAWRLSFSFERMFRQASMDEGCNRDTAWYAITNSEWPYLK